MPRNTPSTSSSEYDGVPDNSGRTMVGTDESTTPINATRRPSVDWYRLPSVTRRIAAARTGTATRKPCWAAVIVMSLLMNGASGPYSTQTVKPVSKYRKQATSERQLPLFKEVSRFFIGILGVGRLWRGIDQPV